MEKYKKKLQEGADLRQHVKVTTFPSPRFEPVPIFLVLTQGLERQNADLVDKNASLEEEYRKVAAFKPLMESYKSQIVDLESKHSTRTQQLDALKFELEQNRNQLRIALEERAKDSETLELYQERVRELELTSHRSESTPQVAGGSRSIRSPTDVFMEAELLGGAAETQDHESLGWDGELDDAIAGTTMTDLKLQIRKLKRDMEGVRKNEADASRVLVLENLLEDANRMKTRYEHDYLAAHREKLVLQRDLEEIRTGKSMGDG